MVFPKDGYQGDYIGELAAGCVARHGEALVDEPGDGIFRETAETQIFGEIRKTLSALGIEFDVYTNERDLYDSGETDRVLADLSARGCSTRRTARAGCARPRAGSSATAWS